METAPAPTSTTLPTPVPTMPVSPPVKDTVFGEVTSGFDVLQGLTPRTPLFNPPPGDKILWIGVAERN